MRFLHHKRKQTPAVIIVALIDVLIVLLIFLMVTTTFKEQPRIRIALPESTQAQRTGASEKAPFIVTIDAKGVLRLGPDELPVTYEQLKSDLLDRAAKDPQMKLAISADKAAPWEMIVKVMDAAKAAKLQVAEAFMKEAPASR